MGLIISGAPVIRRRQQRGEGVLDAATLAAILARCWCYRSKEVAARDGSALLGAGECLVADRLGSLDFSAAKVTLLTRAA